MPLSTTEWAEFISRLQGRGWQVEGSLVMAPNRSIWFERDRPWPDDDLGGFRDRMTGRLERIRRFMVGEVDHLAEAKASEHDTEGIVEELKRMSPGSGD